MCNDPVCCYLFTLHYDILRRPKVPSFIALSCHIIIMSIALYLRTFCHQDAAPKFVVDKHGHHSVLRMQSLGTTPTLHEID